MGVRTVKKKMMNGKIDQLVPGTVRSITGSLLVAGALFWLGLMSILAQTLDLDNGLVASYPFNGNANDESGNNCEVNGATLTDDEAVAHSRKHGGKIAER